MESVTSVLAAERTGQVHRSAAPIAFLLDHLRGGGAQKIWLTIANALAERGYRTDLVVCQAQGPLLARLSPRLNLVELKPTIHRLAQAYAVRADPGQLGSLLAYFLLSPASPTLPYLPDLVRYLQRERPGALYAMTPDMNIEAALARRRAGVATRLIISERNNIWRGHPLGAAWHSRLLSRLQRRYYLLADAIVAVSSGVARDLAYHTELPLQRIQTIYNPVITPELADRMKEPVLHPWFDSGSPPVILGAGRLGRQKDFPTLIRAFARVRWERPVRLLILGAAKNSKKTAKSQAELMQLATELGVAADVSLPGYAPNPLPFMAQAAVFVLSSRYEGLPNVLLEALACGCPIVSTDCPSGPAEILENGKFGQLVPVGDDAAMAAAITSVLDTPPDSKVLQQRAALFSIDRAVERYEALLTNTAISR